MDALLMTVGYCLFAILMGIAVACSGNKLVKR